MSKRNGIKIMVASTVYGFETELDLVYNQLDKYGYDVLNSHMGTLYAGAEKSNLENCLQGVEECDVFYGIIRPQYGSGIIGETSITHEEVLKAILLQKARWFLVNSKVVFARQLLNTAEIVDKHTTTKINLNDIIIRPNNLIDIRSILIYQDVLLSKVPVAERKGHWVQEFSRMNDITRFTESQFSKVDYVRRTIDFMNSLN